MTPEKFVVELKQVVRDGVESEIEYYANPPVENPPGHLGVFSRWYQSLSNEDKEIARQALGYAAEGSLFALLNILDNVQSIPSTKGELELYYVEGNTRIRLNDPEANFLYDIFNNTE